MIDRMPNLRILRTARTDFLLFIAAALVVALGLASQAIATDTFSRYRTLVDTISDVKQAVTETHLWLEARLSGDLGVDTTALIDQPLDEALGDCRAILDGGLRDRTQIAAVQDPPMRGSVKSLCQRIAEMHVAATERLAQGGTSAGVGSDLDQQFDAIFQDVKRLADESDVALDATIEAEVRVLALVNAGIIVLVTFLFLGVSALFRRFRRLTASKSHELVVAGEESRRLLDESRHEAVRAEVFNLLSDRVTFANGEADLVDAATAALRRLVPSVAGDVLLLNSSQDRLMVTGAWGSAECQVGRPATVDNPALCPGIRRGAVYALGDGTDDLAVGCAAHPIAAGSSLCVPMLALGKTVGVIHLVRAEIDGFDVSSQQLAARAAEQVALGLANARMMQTMEGLAMADPLTGLYNARFFDPLLERELAAAKRDGGDLAVIMIDIEDRKSTRLNSSHSRRSRMPSSA